MDAIKCSESDMRKSNGDDVETTIQRENTDTTDNVSSCPTSNVQIQRKASPHIFLTLTAMIIFLPTGILALRQSIQVFRALKLEDDVIAFHAYHVLIQHILASYFLGFLTAAAVVTIYFLFVFQV